MLTIYGYGDNEEGSAQARRYPLSYVLAGYYSYSDAALNYQEVTAIVWTSTSVATNDARTLRMTVNAYLTPQHSGLKTTSRSLRCISAGSVLVRRYPLGLVMAGLYYWGNSQLSYQDNDGIWWTKTSTYISTAYVLLIYQSQVRPQNDFNNAHGNSLRCLIHAPVETASRSAIDFIPSVLPDYP